jgi:hypothetical protein
VAAVYSVLHKKSRMDVKDNAGAFCSYFVSFENDIEQGLTNV